MLKRLSILLLAAVAASFCFVASVALAQTPAIEVTGELGGNVQWWIVPLQAVLSLVGFVLVGLLSAYGVKIVKFVEAKTHSRFLGDLTHNLLSLVLSYYQTEVRHLQRTSQWDDKAKADMKNRAIDHIKQISDPKRLAKAAGGMAVEEFVGHQVEAAVATVKKMGAAQKAATETKQDPTKS